MTDDLTETKLPYQLCRAPDFTLLENGLNPRADYLDQICFSDVAQAEKRRNLPDFSKPIQASEFGDKIFAVHATKFLPKDGVMKAGASDISGEIASIATEPASFRPTIHFALGGLVREHHHAYWENAPYAVIVPLRAMKDQLINLSASDTFILGDYSIPKDAIMVLPMETAQTFQAPPGVKVFVYDPATTSIRAAIDNVIEINGGWRLDLPPSKPGHNAVVKIGGKTVDFSKMSEDFLRDNPRISEGSHTYSVKGFAGRFGTVDQAISHVRAQYKEHGRVRETVGVVFLRDLIQHHVACLDKELKAEQFPAAAMRTYQEKKDKLAGWLNLINADIELRKTSQLTFAGTGTIAIEISKSRHSSSQLQRAIKKQLASGLLNSVVSNGTIDAAIAAECLAASPPAEFELHHSALEENNAMGAGELRNLRHQYALRRTLYLGMDAAKKEGLLDMLTDRLVPTRPASYRKTLMDELFIVLGKDLDEDSRYLQTALAVIQLPVMREAFGEYYGVEIPSEKPLTLDAYLRLHPQTKDAYVALDFSDLDPDSLKIIQMLAGELADARKDETIRSYNEAFWLAQGVRSTADYIKKSTEELKKPMNSARDLKQLTFDDTFSFYEYIKSEKFGGPEDVWARLGLRREYRDRFPTDSSFWESDDSFKQIYESLSLKKTEP